MAVGKGYVPPEDASEAVKRTIKWRNAHPERYRETQRRLMRERRAKARAQKEQNGEV